MHSSRSGSRYWSFATSADVLALLVGGDGWGAASSSSEVPDCAILIRLGSGSTTLTAS
jgi:hypothetical protein